MLDNQQQAFLEEAGELLSELENSLLELEERPADPEVIGRVFRAMHTIKGSGAMFGFDEVSAFTHKVETVFHLVRNGELAVTGELVDLSLQARDQIQGMLESARGGEPVDAERGAALVAAFEALVPEGQGAAGDGSKNSPSPAAAPAEEPKAPLVTYRIRFSPPQDLLLRGSNPLCLFDELRELGECHVVAQTDAIAPLEALDPEVCLVHWDIVLTTSAGRNAIDDVFIFVADESDLVIEVVDDGEGEGEGYRRLGEILIARGDLTPEALEAVCAGRKRLGELLVEARLVAPEQIESALAEQEQVRKVRQQRSSAKTEEGLSSIRVPADRLDRLVDLVGELVTVQSRLSQVAGSGGDSALVAIAEEVERLTEELRDQTLGIRMLPIGTTFSKFKRLVRDLAKELGKEIELTTAGAETELDKTVIERLNDPLVHIIRNSLDHGIETPAVREKAGKPGCGTVHLQAEHSGDSVSIEIRDDGAGLDAEKIRSKAIEKKLIGEHDELSEQEIYQLIFAPGFSTAASISAVSGRGVGMDVVKRAIDALRGTIAITSTPGEGTTIRLRIPLTLAIIESLLVRLGDDHYVLPLAVVEECIELTAAERAAHHGRNLVRVRDQLVPYLRLREQFELPGSAPAIEQVVVTHYGGQRIGLVVDHVIGEHQTVIKSLGRLYREVRGVSGATILGDGSVALILDVPQLIEDAEAQERRQAEAKDRRILHVTA